MRVRKLKGRVLFKLGAIDHHDLLQFKSYARALHAGCVTGTPSVQSHGEESLRNQRGFYTGYRPC